MAAPTKKFNIYEEVTNKIIEALEAGVTPWAKPWASAKHGALRNAVTNRPYRGLNTLLLGVASMVKGYTDPRWLTYKNAVKLGGAVRKGEKGTQVIFWNFLTVENNASAATPARDKKIPFIRAYTVFNVQQCDNLNIPSLVVAPTVQEDNTLPEAEAIISIADVVYGGDRPAYMPSLDKISLPLSSIFKSINDYYTTAFHEVVHWTGHKTRLDRDLANRFGSEAYAFEELVAEMGSAFLCSTVAIPLEGMQHPEYINSWLQVLREDNRAIFTAASKAQQAADFVVKAAGLVQEEDVEESE